MPLRRVSGQPTWLLSRANARAQGILHEAFAAAGTRPYHYRLLAALEQDGPQSQAQLGRRTAIDRSDVAGALNELADRRVVRREPDPGDARRNIVSLTDAGRAELARLDTVLAAVQADVTSALTRRERDELVRLLAKLGPTDA